MYKNFRGAVTTLARRLNLAACAICCLLAGISAAFPQAAPGTQAAPSPPAPPTPVQFDDALLRAANDLLDRKSVV